MKLSFEWLKQFVPELSSVEATAKVLGEGGIAVASVRPFTAAYEGVVVGSVCKVSRHPNADRLSVCTVEAESGRIYDVVCGAANVRAGMKVPFAQPGARLPGDRVINAATIRGVASQGMLCSAVEIGEGSNADGILELGDDAIPGEPYVPRPEDWVLDIEITPNRGDALSVLGVARQLAALLRVPYRLPWEGGEPAPGVVSTPGISVAVEDPDGCGLYTGRLLTDMTVAPSPEWMRKRLMACGMRPISNVVDITNYVLLELGQPLHAFDVSRISGGKIVVRRARDGEMLRTLDGVNRKLSAEILVIADGDTPVAAAGVMGGASSEITANTRGVLLESAWFDPVRIRRGARRLGLGTESSYRFERGVDPEGVERASNRAAQLLVELAGAKIASPLLVASGNLPVRPTVEVRAEDASELLGISLTVGNMKEYSRLIGASVNGDPEHGNAIRVMPPSWRLDLNIAADMVEEFAIMHGYQNIPSTMPELQSAPLPLSKREGVEAVIRESLRGAGFSEAHTFSFMSRGDLIRMGWSGESSGPQQQAAALANPQGEEHELMRTTILPGLLRSASYNLARSAAGVLLFEIGNVFRGVASSGSGLKEEAMITIIAAGSATQDAYSQARPMDFYDIKGAVDVLATALGFSFNWSPASEKPYEFGQCAAIKTAGGDAGSAGVLAPGVAAAFDLPAGVACAEILLDVVVGAASLADEVRAPARYPAMRRDLAVVVAENVSTAALRVEIGKAGLPLLESAEVFDIYRGKQLGEGAKSIAFRVVFRSADRTLMEGEVDEAVGRIVARLETSLGAKLRQA